MTEAEIQAAFRSESGADTTLVPNADITRWFNEGQSEFAARQRRITLFWEEGQPYVTLPSDFRTSDLLHGVVLDPLTPANWLLPGSELVPHNGAGVSHVLPPYRIWGSELRFSDDNGAPYEGAGQLTFWAEWPRVSASQASELPMVGDRACLAYSLYRFYAKLVNSTVEYHRYTQLVTRRTAQGVDAPTLDDLAAEADRQYQAFLTGKAEVEGHQEAALFFSEG